MSVDIGSEIFVSYRHVDTADTAIRLANALRERFGSTTLFRDEESIRIGADINQRIFDSLMQARVLIVLIGPNWLQTDALGASRLASKKDPVNMELSFGLLLGLKILPVLVGGAKMPTEAQLPEDLKKIRNFLGIPLTDGSWQEGIDKISQEIGRYVGGRPAFSVPTLRDGREGVARKLRDAGAISGTEIVVAIAGCKVVQRSPIHTTISVPTVIVPTNIRVIVPILAAAPVYVYYSNISYEHVIDVSYSGASLADTFSPRLTITHRPRKGKGPLAVPVPDVAALRLWGLEPSDDARTIAQYIAARASGS